MIPPALRRCGLARLLPISLPIDRRHGAPERLSRALAGVFFPIRAISHRCAPANSSIWRGRMIASRHWGAACLDIRSTACFPISAGFGRYAMKPGWWCHFLLWRMWACPSRAGSACSRPMRPVRRACGPPILSIPMALCGRRSVTRHRLAAVLKKCCGWWPPCSRPRAEIVLPPVVGSRAARRWHCRR